MNFPILIFDDKGCSVIHIPHGDDTVIGTWLAVTKKNVIGSYIIDSDGAILEIINIECVEHVPWWKKTFSNPMVKIKLITKPSTLGLVEAQNVLISLLRHFNEIGLREFLDYDKVYKEIYSAQIMLDLLNVMIRVYSDDPDFYPDEWML
jgi:hypothetical protein